MRHYVAMQDEAGRWFYANEGQNRKTGEYGWTPSGACGKWMNCPDPACRGMTNLSDTPTDRDCKTCGGKGAIENPNPCQGHATAEEAYEHQKQRILAERVRFCEDVANPRTQHRCAAVGCETFTSGSAMAGAYQHWHLCADHRNTETVSTLLEVGESWES